MIRERLPDDVGGMVFGSPFDVAGLAEKGEAGAFGGEHRRRAADDDSEVAETGPGPGGGGEGATGKDVGREHRWRRVHRRVVRKQAGDDGEETAAVHGAGDPFTIQ